jgi:Flp pilus assembly protein TadD
MKLSLFFSHDKKIATNYVMRNYRKFHKLRILLIIFTMINYEVFSQEKKAPEEPGFDPAEVYYQAWLYTRDAEKLKKENRNNEAMEKLKTAEKFFLSIFKFHPEWKKEMITGRLEITKKYIAGIAPEALKEQEKETNAIAELEGGKKIGAQQMPNRKIEPNITMVDPQVEILEKEIRKLRSAIASSSDANIRESMEKNDLQTDKDHLRSKLKRTENELQSMQEKLSVAPVKSEMDRINSRVKSIEREKEAMSMALNQSRNEQLQSQAKINILTADLQAVRQQAANFERNLIIERKAANELTNAQQEQMSALQNKLKEKDAEITAANNRVLSAEKELAEFKQIFGELQTERDGLIKEKEHMSALLNLNKDGRIQQLIDQNMSLAKELKQAKERTEQFNKDNLESQNEYMEALRDLAIAKNKIISLQKEKRSQDERSRELEEKLKIEEAEINNNVAQANVEEVNTLKDIIKRQLSVQERRKKATELLLDAAKNGVVGEAVNLLTDTEISLTPEEQKLLADNRFDDEFVSPYARNRSLVGKATNDLEQETESNSNAALRAFTAERYNAAKEILEMNIDRNPGNISTMISLGVVQMKLNDNDAAVKILQHAVEMNESNATSLRMLGLANYKVGQWENAEQSCKKATEIDASDAESYTYMGNSQLLLGKSQEAEKSYKAAIAANGSLSEPLHNLAFLYANNNRKKEATEYYEKSLQNGGLKNIDLEKKLR